MPEDQSSLKVATRRVGPPVLLGLRPKVMQRAVKAAQRDERIRALSIWGSLAQGDADEWEGVQFVISVTDASVQNVVEELSQRDSLFGQSLVTLPLPQNGVEGGDFVSVLYYQSTLLLNVDWYVCPASFGLPTHDTKVIYTLEHLPNLRTSFAELLRERPSQKSFAPPEWDVVASMIPIHIKEVVRGRPEAVLIDRKTANDPIEAYDELSRQIAALPASHADLRAPLFYLLGIARRGF